MFASCFSLVALPNISKWDTSNVVNMSEIFSYCSYLTSLPDLSKWKTDSLINMSKIYAVCFKDGGKCYYFKSDLEHEIDQYVIVDTEKGEQFAKIVGVNIEKNFKETIKDIIRIATDDDYEQHLKNLKDAGSI